MNKIIILLFGLSLATAAFAQSGAKTAPQQTAPAPKNGNRTPVPQDLPTGIDASKQAAGQNADGAKTANRRTKPALQDLPNPAGEKGGQKKTTAKAAVQDVPNAGMN